MIESKLAEGEQELRNVQVRLVEEEEALRVIKLVNEEGSFLRVEIGPKDEPERPLAVVEEFTGADW